MEKLKAGIFNSPQNRELMKEPMSDKTLSEAELSYLAGTKVSYHKLLGKPPERRI